MIVSNMTTPQGNAAPHQHLFEAGDGVVAFQSYYTVVALKNAPLVTASGEARRGYVLDHRASNYSRTTSRYLHQFFNATAKEVKAWIAAGETPNGTPIIREDLSSFPHRQS
jgi:hypothetical protein